MILTCTKRINENNTDKCLGITYESTHYRIRIHYLQPDYQRHKQKQDFDPNDINIAIVPKNKQTKIKFLVSLSNKIIGISPPEDLYLLSEKEINDYTAEFQEAVQIVKELKVILKTLFYEQII